MPRSSGSRLLPGRVAAPVQQRRACQPAELATQRLGGRDQQRRELVQPSSLRDRRAVASSHQRPQRFSLAAAAGERATLLREHTPSSSDRVERIRLAGRRSFAAKSANLEHLLVMSEQKPAQACPVRSGALNRERASARGMFARELKRLRVTVAVGSDARLEEHHPARHPNHRERVHVTVRVDADHEIQLICKHHRSTSSPGWGTTPVPAWA